MMLFHRSVCVVLMGCRGLGPSRCSRYHSEGTERVIIDGVVMSSTSAQRAADGCHCGGSRTMHARSSADDLIGWRRRRTSNGHRAWQQQPHPNSGPAPCLLGLMVPSPGIIYIVVSHGRLSSISPSPGPNIPGVAGACPVGHHSKSTMARAPGRCQVLWEGRPRAAGGSASARPAARAAAKRSTTTSFACSIDVANAT